MAAHYQAARHFERRHYWIGIPALILSTTVGTTVFAVLRKDIATPTQIATGAASIAAAVLTALQTFLGYSQRAAKHYSAGAKYASLVRAIHKELAFPTSEDNKLREWVESIRVRFDKLSEESPSLPEKVFKRAISEAATDE